VIAATLGGIGIFLIGMILLTDGLKAAAGGTLKNVLQRFARGPVSSLVSGAGVTALVQSSSATTLTTIGFVSAGLLTFPQAVGVILGANVGTTSTGWIVSLLGLKVSVGVVALPLVGAGALTRLVARGRLSHVGLALAGFGLIFVGIDSLQAGMSGLAGRFDPGAFPGGSAHGRAMLVLVGLGMTVVMQSSSAAVATTLTALHSGAIDLEQSAYLVVGQNVGTTVTAALASLGAGVPARRTAAAHILFNLLTAALALVTLPVLLPLTLRVAGTGDPATAVALFHTTFNLLGVAVVLPVLPLFARLVERLVPEKHRVLTRHLDRTVSRIPSVAVEAARQATEATAVLLFGLLADEVGPERPPAEKDRVGSGADEGTKEALAAIRAFLASVRTDQGSDPEFERHLSVLHAMDHLGRIRTALDTADGSTPPWNGGPFALAAAHLARALAAGDGIPSPETLGRISGELASLRRETRARVLEATARGELTPDGARVEIEWAKRIDRLAYHAWRTAFHLRRAGSGSGPAGDGDAYEDSEEDEEE
jgi:phosphate:Na+ symporter